MSAAESYASAKLRERTNWILESGSSHIEMWSEDEECIRTSAIDPAIKSNWIQSTKVLPTGMLNPFPLIYGVGATWILLAKYVNESYLKKDVERLFTTLAEDWERQAFVTSSIEKQVLNESYQRIIGLGPAAVPLILNRLKMVGGNWFWALRAITGEDPVLPQHYGNYDKVRSAWLQWGADKGLANA